jgi:hypothetical protein
MAHFPRDDFELSFQCLIFAYDIPDTNWGDRSGGEYEVMEGVERRRTGARRVS